MKDYELIHNKEMSRYEFRIDGLIADADYKRVNDVLVITHVGVPYPLEGQGIASQLVKKVLEDIKSQGLKVRPVCPFVVAYIHRHPEWNEIMA
jgi:predicted GNAT family acetyltransferase